MRLTVQPENLLEAIILKLRKIPHPFLRSILGMGVSQVLFTAVRLNLFDRLKDTPKTAVELAKETDCNLHGMQVLLESLDGFGFLRYKGDKYQLTPESSRWLTGTGTQPTISRHRS